LIVAIMLSSCGCLGGGQSNDTNTAPLANSLLVFRSVEVMVGYNTSLSCVLNITNGQGLDNQVVYLYLDGQPLGQSSTYFGFATYNLSVSDVSGLALGEHQILAEYKGNGRLCGLTSGRRVARYRGTNANTNPNAKTNRNATTNSNTNPNAKTNRNATTNRNTNPTPRPTATPTPQPSVVASPDAQTYNQVRHKHPQQVLRRPRRGERDRLPKVRGRVVAARSAADAVVTFHTSQVGKGRSMRELCADMLRWSLRSVPQT